MQQEFSIITLILNASIVVQFVIAILLLFSVISWGIILNKFASLAKAKFDTNSFNKQYNATTNISDLFISVSAKNNKNTTAALFYNGITEYNKLTSNKISNNNIILDNIERSLNATTDIEIAKYESSLSTLATFGSVSPYIGLLGTVWGIMHAFIGLGSTGQATLALVAPGIAEALVATAIGLFVAIPAYIFYNKYTADINLLASKMYKFNDDFLNFVNRRLASNEKQANTNEF
ncbi:MAG: protein TolQ [Pseudomonadota bacterium]|nr:protein TolQ [Burkholderiales bacterium]